MFYTVTASTAVTWCIFRSISSAPWGSYQPIYTQPWREKVIQSPNCMKNPQGIFVKENERKGSFVEFDQKLCCSRCSPKKFGMLTLANIFSHYRASVDPSRDQSVNMAPSGPSVWESGATVRQVGRQDRRSLTIESGTARSEGVSFFLVWSLGTRFDCVFYESTLVY